MANNDNIDRVIESLKSSDELGFNMWFYSYPTSKSILDLSGRGCGTVGCIAGHCVFLHYGQTKSNVDAFSIGMEFLDITEDQADELFQVGEPFVEGIITLEQAIATLEHLKETGEVKWQTTTTSTI